MTCYSTKSINGTLVKDTEFLSFVKVAVKWLINQYQNPKQIFIYIYIYIYINKLF